jgi:hypothetical protein
MLGSPRKHIGGRKKKVIPDKRGVSGWKRVNDNKFDQSKR